MDFADRDAEIEKLEAALAALEERAGIAAQMEGARDECSNPQTALGAEETVTPDEDVAYEYDELKEKERTRDCYFGVKDVELRKELIRTHREVDDQYQLLLDEGVTEIKGALSAARARAKQLPWRSIAATAAAPVALGYWVFHSTGAIVGAAPGLFLGMAIAKGARKRRAEELKKAEADFKEAKEEARVLREGPRYFSLVEEHSGERDAMFDRQSALEQSAVRKRETHG